MWIKKYCSIKNREVYNQAIDDFADGISEILKDNVIHNMALLGNFNKIMNCINTLAEQLKDTDKAIMQFKEDTKNNRVDLQDREEHER